MLPIPSGSDITGQYVEDWQAIKPDTACIVILNGNQDFVFKLVTILTDENVLLKSLNPEYRSYMIALEDIVEIWKFQSFTSRKLPEAITDLGRVLKEIRGLKGSLQ